MSAIFLPEDVRQLLKGKTVVYIGDSVQRSMYKDLVLLFQDKRYLTDQELRAKGELCFLGDDLMEGGKKGEMNNSTKYREVRKYLYDSQTKVLYFFITACFGEYIDMLLKKLMKPDIIFMNSCLWDVHRYGTKGYEGYGPNLLKLVKLVKQLHPDILFAWTTTPPVDIRSKAGFLEDRKDLVKINEVLRCNDIARGIMRKEGIPIADFADVFRHFTHHRANDGVHWNERAHRRMTNILLETVARRFNRPVPRPVSDDFNRMGGDFLDRPPFPHSFSQPAFHHNDSWGSFDEERWHWDSFMNGHPHDDYILGLDRSYGGGNYSYFESDDEMPPRFLPLPPPPGRRMLMDRPTPPQMRPPPPPGYRFGTNDPILSRDGRKRKGREDEMIENFNKRQRIDSGRKLSVGSERRTPSPLVENKSIKENENDNKAKHARESPDLEEKPRSNQTEANRKDTTNKMVGSTHKDVGTIQKMPAGPHEDEEASVAPSVDHSAMKGTDKDALVESEFENNGNAYAGDAKAGGGTEDVILEEKPCFQGAEGKPPMNVDLDGGFKPETDASILKSEQESPALGSFATTASESDDAKSTSAPETAPQDSNKQVKERSVFGKLSSTTSKILQSIMKSSKKIASSLTLPENLPETIDVKANDEELQPPRKGQEIEEANVDSKKDAKSTERPALEEKSAPENNQVNNQDTCNAHSDDVVYASAEQAPSEIKKVDIELAENNVDSTTVNMEEDEEAKEIAFYDVEVTLEDIEASLDRMDEDFCDETIDLLDEESLLMDDTDKLSSAGQISEDLSRAEKANSHKEEQDLCSADEKTNAKIVKGPELNIKNVDESQHDKHVVEIKDNKGQQQIDANDNHTDISSKETPSSDSLQRDSCLMNKAKDDNDIAMKGNEICKKNEPTRKVQDVQEQKLTVNVKAFSIEKGSPNKSEILNEQDTKFKSQKLTPKMPFKSISKETLNVSPINTPSTQKTLQKPVLTSTPVEKKSPKPLMSFDIEKPNSEKPPRPAARSPFSPSPTNTRTVPSTQKPRQPLPVSTSKSNVHIQPALVNKPTPGPGRNFNSNQILSPTNMPSPGNKGAVSKPLPSSESRPKHKLPCVPNPPSLDMKSPFFKPKPSIKTNVTAPVVSAPVTVKSVGSLVESFQQPSSSAGSNTLSQGSKMQPRPTVDARPLSHGETSGNRDELTKTVTTTADAEDKKGNKRKVKTKVGKKTTKKLKTDGAGKVKSNDNENLKKTSKKIKKKKTKKGIASKTKGGSTAEKPLLETSPRKKKDMPHTIEIIAGTDRPKPKTLRTDSYNENRQIQGQIAVSSGHSLPPVYLDQNQQYQPHLQQIAPTQYFQNFTPAQPQIITQTVPSQAFQYGQQLYANQPNQLGFPQQYNPAVATNKLYLAQGSIPEYQRFEPVYYPEQIVNQPSDVRTNFPIANANKSKSEYAHLAWL